MKSLIPGTDYSPVCLFCPWLQLHPYRLSSGLQCVRCPMGCGPVHYTWGPLPLASRSPHAACRPSRLSWRGSHPHCKPLNTHFQSLVITVITMIALSMASLSAVEWSLWAISPLCTLPACTDNSCVAEQSVSAAWTTVINTHPNIKSLETSTT